ncbi:MAG: hypothetical protein WD098_00105 [Balneolales bacterium]
MAWHLFFSFFFLLSALTSPFSAYSYDGKDDQDNFPLKFWNYLYKNQFYQPVIVLSQSLESGSEDWSGKAILGANSYWHLNQHKHAIRYFRMILEKGEMGPETKKLHQRTLEGWYLSQRLLPDYQGFISEQNHDANVRDSFFYLNQIIYEGFSRNRNMALNAFSSLQDISSDAFMNSTEINSLKNELNILKSSKSPFLGGIMSAIVPGSGSVYAGRPWDALYSFILTSGFAALTGESIINNGIRHPTTLILGGIGISFHVGNIYGSYHRVVEHNKSLFYEFDITSDHILDQYYSPE